MKKSYNRQVSFRLPLPYYKKIVENFVTKQYSVTDFLVEAVREKLYPKDLDMDLLSHALNKVNRFNESAEKQRDMLLLLMNQFIQYFFLYHDDLDYDNMTALVASSNARHSRFIDRLMDTISDNHKSFIREFHGGLTSELLATEDDEQLIR